MTFRSLDCLKRPGNDHLHCNLTQGLPPLLCSLGVKLAPPSRVSLKHQVVPWCCWSTQTALVYFLPSFPKHLPVKCLARDFESPSARDPMDSANCLGWGLRTAFLGPAGNTELCLCVFIGFLGSGTHDGWRGNRGESAPDPVMNQRRQF